MRSDLELAAEFLELIGKGVKGTPKIGFLVVNVRVEQKLRRIKRKSEKL